VKVDYHINDHHSLSGSYFIGNLNSLWVTAPDQLAQRWQNIIQVRVPTYGGHWTWTPNSRWVNELRAGYGQTHQINLSNDGTVNPAAPWPTGYGFNTGVTNPLYFEFPYLQISGFSNFSLGHGTHTNSTIAGSFDLVDNISYLRGKHSFKFGGEFIYARIHDLTYADSEGRIKFGSLQDYLLGIPANGRLLVGQPLVQGRDGFFAGFFQDDWRATKTLTLNLGLRYEYAMPSWELNHLYGNFLPNLGLVQAGVQVPSLVNNDYREFSPRVGLAWDVTGNGKTVVHAGFSVLYPTAVFPNQAEVGSAPFGADIVVNGVTKPGPQLGSFEIDYNSAQLLPGWQNNSPNVPLYPIANQSINRLECGDGVGADPGPCDTQAVDPNIRVPHNLNWNLDIQRAIMNNLTLDVAYVGNHSTGLNAQIELNQPPIGAGWFGPHQAAAACLASAPTYNNCNPSIADEIAARPFQSQFPYLEFIEQQRNLDISNYNGLQVTVTQRSYHGLYFLAGYTYSHALDDLSALGSNNFKPLDSALPQLEYGSSDFDVRHHFSFSLTYALPAEKSPGQILEGWKVNSVVTLQSGLPWGVQDTSDDFTGTGDFTDKARSRWDFTGNPSAFTSGPNPIPCFGPGTGCNPTIPSVCMSAAQANGPLAVASLVNLGCFVQGSGVLTPPAYGSIGTMGRNIFRDGGLKNLDFSVVKEWKFKERLTADFRAEFFNVLNHPNFSNPYGARSGYDNNDPSGGLGFGCGCITPDAATGNFVLGSGGARDIQLGLKLIF
jgi:TonB dependent receptor-like, beta-barrel